MSQMKEQSPASRTRLLGINQEPLQRNQGKSRRHRRDKNHPLLLLNNSPGPSNTISPSHTGAVCLCGSRAERPRCGSGRVPTRRAQPGFGKRGRVHWAAAGSGFTSGFWISFVPPLTRIPSTGGDRDRYREGRGGRPERR